MKRITLLFVFIAAVAFLCSSCTPSPAAPASAGPSETASEAPTSLSPSIEPSPSPPPSVAPSPSLSPSAEPLPSPEPSAFGETPDKAGDDEDMFDIYESEASADLNQDGTPEEIKFTAGSSKSTLEINGKSYTVKHGGLAQLFAVTDVNKSDDILELAFTWKYDSDLADSEKAFTYLYWWTGSKLIEMGSLMDVKFAGGWRDDFDPKDHFDGKGLITCLARTEHFSDTWYKGRYKCKGSDRKLSEELYATKPVNQQERMTLKHDCLLLKHGDSKYFKSAYAAMWDDAGAYGIFDRNYSDEAVSFIPQTGEQLKIVGVIGKNWFKMEASDGKKGWLKCIDKKVQGYYQVMGIDAYDIFEGIVVAG